MSIRTLGLLGLLAVAPAFAATPIDQSRPLDADGQVSIDNLKGRIVVRVWNQPQVRIAGTLGDGVEKLIVDGDAHALRIKVKYPNQSGGWNLWSKGGNRAEPSVIEVTVPQRASLDLDSVSADVDVQGTAGRRLSVDSVSGLVQVAASSPGEVNVSTVSGDIGLRLTSSKVKVETVSGDLNMQGGLTGEVHLESVSGDMKMIAQTLNSLELSTVSGDASLQMDLAQKGSISTDSVSGNIDLSLPKTVGANLHAESFSGDISSPVGQVRKEEFGPGSSLDTRFGTGQAQIKLKSFSGDIRLRLR